MLNNLHTINKLCIHDQNAGGFIIRYEKSLSLFFKRKVTKRKVQKVILCDSSQFYPFKSQY